MSVLTATDIPSNNHKLKSVEHGHSPVDFFREAQKLLNPGNIWKQHQEKQQQQHQQQQQQQLELDASILSPSNLDSSDDDMKSSDFSVRRDLYETSSSERLPSLSEISLDEECRDSIEDIQAPTPSRTGSPIRMELLEIVRKHSENLLRPLEWVPYSLRPVDGPLMDPRYWREMLDMFFVRGWGQGDTSLQFNHDALFDDMLFFVRARHQEGESTSEIDEESTAHDKKPYFVRRWGNDLSKVVGSTSCDVDWRQSFYLNLICHTAYTLTIATCSRQALDNYRKNPRGHPVKPYYKVTKRVYASPSIARVDGQPLQETAVGFPDIFFSVDDHSDAFDPIILKDPDYCLCVMLNAHGGAAFPMEELSKFSSTGQSRRTSSQAQAFGEDIDGTPKVTLFSGFVNYPMVRGNFHGGAMFINSPLPPERLVVKGPGGQGEADITVWGLPEETQPPRPDRSKLPPRPPRARPPLPPATAQHRQPPPAHAPPPAMSLGELQSQLVRVKDQLLCLVQAQQALVARVDISPEQKAREEKQCQQQLLSLHEELRLVQRKLEVLQRQERSKAAAAAAAAAAASAASSSNKPGDAMNGSITDYVYKTVNQVTSPALQCSLRALSVPWDTLVFDLLFKGVPMKVDISGHVLNRPIPRNEARKPIIQP